MKDLAPDILRQRLLIEGYFTGNVDESTIREYFTHITQTLNLRTYGAPIIHGTGATADGTNEGYDAFVPLLDSGIALYVWTNKKFFSVVMYTCKSFDIEIATSETKAFFKSSVIESEAF
jgi:S-adenosylmethionine decarboxylase